MASKPVRVSDTTGETEPWVNCPDCKTGPGIDHLKDCRRAGWNVSKYTKPLIAASPR